MYFIYTLWYIYMYDHMNAYIEIYNKVNYTNCSHFNEHVFVSIQKQAAFALPFINRKFVTVQFR